MKGSSKKIVTAAAAGALVLTLTLTAYAMGTPALNGGTAGNAASQSQQLDGQTPFKGGPGKGGFGGHHQFGAPDTSKLEAAIAAVTDTTKQAALTADLAAYKDALAAEQALISAGSTDTAALDTARDNVRTARETLMTALKDAGVVPDFDGKPMGGPREFDTNALEAAIAKVTDTAKQAALTADLTAYKDTLAAEQALISAGSTDTTALDTARDNVCTARETLMTALKDAGVVPDFDGKPMGGPRELDTAALEAAIAAVTDTAKQTALTADLAAYNDALAAEQALTSAGSTDTDALKTARDNVHDAMRTLMDALKDAGVRPGALMAH